MSDITLKYLFHVIGFVSKLCKTTPLVEVQNSIILQVTKIQYDLLPTAMWRLKISKESDIPMLYYLSDYTGIGSNQILKIKLKDKKGFIYGNLGNVSNIKPVAAPTESHNASKATSGYLQQFINYEDCIADKYAVPAFRSLSIISSDIESIEIIEDEVFGS